MNLKITVTITDDVYPESTTVDVQATDGQEIHAVTKHMPKSAFWSDYERAISATLEEVRYAVMRNEENE